MNLTPPRISLEQIRTLMLSWWGDPKAFGNAISAITAYTFDAAPTAVIDLLCAAKHYPPRAQVVVLRACNVYKSIPDVYPHWRSLCLHAYYELENEPKRKRIMVGLINHETAEPNQTFDVGRTKPKALIGD